LLSGVKPKDTPSSQGLAPKQSERPRVFVIDPLRPGDQPKPQAADPRAVVAALREKVSFVLSQATPVDEVVLLVNSPGGQPIVSPYTRAYIWNNNNLELCFDTRPFHTALKNTYLRHARTLCRKRDFLRCNGR
jgi:hypothetical protein